MVRGLLEAGDHEAGVELTADLLGQRVAVLDRRILAEQLGPLARREVGEVGVRQRVPDDELISVLAGVGVEDKDVWIHETGQQHAASAQHPEALAPDRRQVRAEHVRDRVEDQVEAAVGECAQIAHVAKHGRDFQTVTVSHHPVLRKLAVRIVQYRDCRACCRQDRALLATAAGQAQHILVRKAVRKPVPAHGGISNEHH